jgi:[acyl-carrier-protein] S-malonyltransferase
MANNVLARMAHTAFAFRGYNVTNLGRTAELLRHPAYGGIVETYLREASDLCTDVLKRPVDLVTRVRDGHETRGLQDYAEDVAFIVAVEIVHIEILDKIFGIKLPQARFAFGYSLGECAALIAAGVYKMADLLRVAVEMGDDCVDLADDVTLAVLLSRGPVLDFDTVRRLCLDITQKGKGVIDISTYLAPNSLLLMGQNGTHQQFDTLIRDVFSSDVAIRVQTYRFPPLHTPIMWQRCIPDRTAQRLQTTPGGTKVPSPPILSLVTGEASYDEFNSREMIHRWVDHPQRLWDVVYKLLAGGIETIVHVGPAPNLLPATFRRLSSNIMAQTRASLARRTFSRLARRPWLTRLLPSSAVLLRAPFVRQIILEDWLLDEAVLP